MCACAYVRTCVCICVRVSVSPFQSNEIAAYPPVYIHTLGARVAHACTRVSLREKEREIERKREISLSPVIDYYINNISRRARARVVTFRTRRVFNVYVELRVEN